MPCEGDLKQVLQYTHTISQLQGIQTIHNYQTISRMLAYVSLAEALNLCGEVFAGRIKMKSSIQYAFLPLKMSSR